MANIQLESLQPGPVNLPAPGQGETRAIYRISGLDEAAIQGFIRLVPILGEAMSGSKLPINEIERVGKMVSVLVQALQDGHLSTGEIVQLVLAAIEAL